MQHQSLIAGKWQNLSFFEQMGNIGSEVGRMHTWQKKDPQSYQHAFTRALELIDLTRSDPRWRTFPRLKELSRVREFLSLAFDTNDNHELSGLELYFYTFALAARLKK
jgi:hypothetical protein